MSEQGEIQQSITGSEYAATSATGNAIITITNYYYREEARLVSSDSTDAADDNLPCPYRGLFHFGPNDADIFFGRKIFIEDFFCVFFFCFFFFVFGVSVCGFSSVVF